MSTTWQTTRLVTTGALLLALLALPAAAQDVPSILISRLMGAVEVMDANTADGAWTDAATGQEIGAGWQLRTGAGAKAQLVFPRDNVVILKENSVLYVDRLDMGGGARLEAGSGNLLVDLQNALAPGSDFEVETPTALAVVRGTKFGAADISEYAVTFHGYRGLVDIFDSAQLSDPVALTPGHSVEVAAGDSPGRPYPSDQAAADFLAGAEDTSAFAARDAALGPVAASLGHLLLRLEDLDRTLGEYESEWTRYEHGGQVNYMLVLYDQILSIGTATSDSARDFGDMTAGNAGLRELLGEAAADDPAGSDFGPDEFHDAAVAYARFSDAIADRFGTADGPLGLGRHLHETADRFAGLYERLQVLSDDAAPLITDHEDLLETLRGTIAPGDPVLGIRWRTIDTDNDGVSDVDEAGLGTDPVDNNEDSGFFPLIAPDDGENVDYPETDMITFEFEPLDSDMVTGYDLLIKAGGRQWLRRDIMDAEDVELSALVGPQGTFHDLLADDGETTLTWLVAANIDEQSLVSRIASRRRASIQTGAPYVTSEQRELTITSPQTTAVANLDAAGPVMLDTGDDIRVVASLEDAAALGQWEFTVVYDPSVLEFETGRRLGLFNGTTLFFGDHLGGVLTVSGSINAAGGDVSGSGDIFELEFTAIEAGATTVEFSEIYLESSQGDPLAVEIGSGVDIDIY